MNPLRWELTWQLANALGVVDRYTVVTPGPADVATLGLVHTLGYIDAVRRASRPGFAFSVGHGCGYRGRSDLPWHAHQCGVDRRRFGGCGAVDRDRAWDGSVELPVDRAIMDTRTVVYPLHGLDPHDPRD